MEARLHDVAAALAARGLDLCAPCEGGLLVGNTRALWDVFTRSRREEEDPLDRYVERAVREVFPSAVIRWAHVPPFFPIQQVARDAGLAWLSDSHLSVHPIYGPWIALRAVVEGDFGAVAPPIAPPCDCARGCGPAFARACAAGVPREPRDLIDTWKLWLAVRDACPVGREHRYSDEQLRHHYFGAARRG